ncbi:MAG: hypothetical protein H7Y32_20620 [Chloroflexales bacterium]|nr:hypothetical protein [Chloroflexales bacterium]
MHNQRRQRNLILLATAVVLLLLAGVGAAALLRPRPIITLNDAVAAVLDRRGIAHERVTTGRAHPITGIYFSYAFDVSVQFGDGSSAVGTIDCSPSQSACFVDMRRLGVHYERMPALERDTRWEWLAWARRVLRRVAALTP